MEGDKTILTDPTNLYKHIIGSEKITTKQFFTFISLYRYTSIQTDTLCPLCTLFIEIMYVSYK